MRKYLFIVLVCAGWILGCGADDGTATSLSKEEITAQLGKGDNTVTERMCRSLGLPANCDVCQAMGWYSDGSCDTFCLNRDPDCGVVTGDATIVIKSETMRGFYVYVDEILMGQDGLNGDPMDGLYTFKVTGNRAHNFRIFDGEYTYHNNIYIASGETRTLYVEADVPNNQILVIVKSNTLRNYVVYVDGQYQGQEGTNGDAVDGVYNFNVKGGMYHFVRVVAGGYEWSQNIKFNAVGTFTISVDPATGPGKPTGSDTDVTLNFHGATRYKVWVDNVEIGTEGVNGDIPDGIYNFKVPGNQYHVVRCSDGLYEYSKSLYFQIGVPMTIDVYKGSY